MKNELRSIKSQLNLLKEKTEEILSFSETNGKKSHKEEIKINIGIQSKQILSNETKDSTRDKCDEKYDMNLTFENVASISMEIIYDNLHKIRDLLQKSNSQEKCQQKFAKKQLQISNKFKNKIIISNLDLKGIEAMIERLPRLVPEEFVKVCKSCKGMFSVCRWKYHCRVCGYIYCFHCFDP